MYYIVSDTANQKSIVIQISNRVYNIQHRNKRFCSNLHLQNQYFIKRAYSGWCVLVLREKNDRCVCGELGLYIGVSQYYAFAQGG